MALHRHVQYSIRLSIIADGNMGFTAYVVLDLYTKSKPYSSALSHEATGTTVDKTDGKWRPRSRARDQFPMFRKLTLRDGSLVCTSVFRMYCAQFPHL